MATPFSIFRKNQKVFLVATTVLCVFAFVALGTIEQLMQANNAGPSNSAVATINGSEIDSRELSLLGHSRATAKRYVGAVIRYGVMPTMQQQYQEINKQLQQMATNPSNQQQFFQMFQLRQQMEQQMNNVASLPDQLFRGESEEDLIRLKVQLEIADSMDISVSDVSIDDFLENFSRFNIASTAFETALNEMREADATFSKGYLYECLRRELSARQVSMLMNTTILQQSSVLDYWEQYNRLNREIRLQYVALPFDDKDILSKIDGKPSSSEMEKLFKKGHFDYTSKADPNPAFAEPTRVTIEYLQVDYAQVEEELRPEVEKAATVSDANVVQSYKDSGSRFEFDPDEKLTEESFYQEPISILDEDGNELVTNSQGWRVPKELTEKFPVGKEILSVLLEEESYQLPRTLEENVSFKRPLTQEIFDELKAELLEEEVKKNLPEEATKKVAAMLEEIKLKMDDVNDEFYHYTEEKKYGDNKELTDKEFKPSVVLKDFAGGALSYHTLEKVSLLEARIVPGFGSSRIGVRGSYWTQNSFSERSTFVPFISVSNEITTDLAAGDHYLFWQTDYSEAVIPESYTEVEDKITYQWKLDKLRDKLSELASAATEELNQQELGDDITLDVALGKLKDSKLEGFLPDLHSATPAETKLFSWMDGSNPRSAPTVSWLGGIDPLDTSGLPKKAGHEFMKNVFAINKGDFGYAFDYAKRTLYLVRVTDEIPVSEAKFFKDLYYSGESAGPTNQPRNQLRGQMGSTYIADHTEVFQSIEELIEAETRFERLKAPK